MIWHHPSDPQDLLKMKRLLWITINSFYSSLIDSFQATIKFVTILGKKYENENEFPLLLINDLLMLIDWKRSRYQKQKNKKCFNMSIQIQWRKGSNIEKEESIKVHTLIQ